MLDRNRIALKEWAVICRALDEGRHIVVLRKGGIREQANGFSVQHREFFLFPTYVHENEAELTDVERALLPQVTALAPRAGTLTLRLYAIVEEAFEAQDLDVLRGLEGQHALAWPAVERRFAYRRPGLHVIALRVHRLPEPLSVPCLPRYDGCRSWVTLESELPVSGARPVLNDKVFHQKMTALRETLAVPPPNRSARG